VILGMVVAAGHVLMFPDDYETAYEDGLKSMVSDMGSFSLSEDQIRSMLEAQMETQSFETSREQVRDLVEMQAGPVQTIEELKALLEEQYPALSEEELNALAKDTHDKLVLDYQQTIEQMVDDTYARVNSEEYRAKQKNAGRHRWKIL